MKEYIWRSTYKESMGEFFARTLKDQHLLDILFMLWGSFRLTYLTKSSFFKSIRLGDEKYELWVHKEKNGVITIKFVIL